MSAKTWNQVRAESVATGQLTETRIEEHKQRMLAGVRAHRLAELRESSGLTQQALAKRLSITQAGVSKIEKGDITRTKVTTLEEYVAALGGKLEITASFGSKKVVIR